MAPKKLFLFLLSLLTMFIFLCTFIRTPTITIYVPFHIIGDNRTYGRNLSASSALDILKLGLGLVQLSNDSNTNYGTATSVVNNETTIEGSKYSNVTSVEGNTTATTVYSTSKTSTEESISMDSSATTTLSTGNSFSTPVAKAKYSQKPLKMSARNESDPVCKIPVFDPWDSTIKERLRPAKLPLVCKGKQQELSSLKNGSIVFDANLLKKNPDISCHYRCISRGEGDHEIIAGKSIQLNLEKETKVECEFPEVRCATANGEIYANIHCQIVPNGTRLQQIDRILPANQRASRHHVIMLIFDAVSRLNFLRLCPKSVSVLQKLYNTTFFNGMTRIGDNSYKNAIAFFAGKNPGNYSDEVLFKQYYDNWDFIWKNFSSNGYLTLDVQDSSTNIFLYLKKGFYNQPTDHRQRVFWLACDKLPGCSHYSEPCFGNHAKHNLQFQYLHDFLNNYESDRPKYVMFWNTCLCHDYIERLAYVDDDLATFLERNFDLLKESYLFVMGDHGHKFSSVRNTLIGHFEANMPLMAFSVPQSLTQEQPQIYKNMLHNSELLVSHYDLYVTMQDILMSEKYGWFDLTKQRDWSTLHLDVSRAQSFLRPISADRTCGQIGIPSESCICEQFVPVALDDSRVGAIAEAVVSNMNNQLQVQPKCAKLTLQKTLAVTELSELSRVSEFMSKGDAVSAGQRQQFRVTLETAPSNGTFEAHVNFDGDKYTVPGRVLRTNRYGEQARCVLVSNPTIKEYCYCLSD